MDNLSSYSSTNPFGTIKNKKKYISKDLGQHIYTPGNIKRILCNTLPVFINNVVLFTIPLQPLACCPVIIILRIKQNRMTYRKRTERLIEQEHLLMNFSTEFFFQIKKYIHFYIKYCYNRK